MTTTHVNRNNPNIRVLSQNFYNKYPREPNYPELMDKEANRRYFVKTIYIDDVHFGLPFRSHISHRYLFPLSKSKNGKRPGLDYSKAVVLKEDTDLGDMRIIDRKQYSILLNKDSKIEKQFKSYLKEFFHRYEKGEHNSEFIKNSTLQYFYDDIKHITLD